MKVYIDAGHGGSDPGAVSGSMRESELNLKSALACRDFLSAYDCQVIMSRTIDIAVPVQNRYKQAIAEKVDAVLCMHHNAGGGDGGEVWFWHTDNRAKELARLTAQEYKAIGQNLRTGAGMPEGVKPSKPDTRQNFGMCREPSAKGIPAILGEFAFVDNATDRQIVDTDAELAEQGKAYGRAVVKFLGLKLKTGAPVVVTQPILTPEVAMKSIEEIAREVINGKWGNGQDRVDRLNAAGYNALTVQAVVNKMITGNKPTTSQAVIPPTPSKDKYKVLVELNGYMSAGNAKARVTPKSKVKAGDYDIFNTSQNMINVTSMAGTPGSWINPADNVIVAPAKESVVVKKAGDAVTLKNTPLYISATAKLPVRKLTGSYYLYSAAAVNGRYRITNSKNRVGKKPAAFNVTGWVSL